MLAGPGTRTQPDIAIRELRSVSDHARMHPIMNSVWGPEFLVPSHLSYKIGEYGGIVLGAFAGEEMVGFNLGLPMSWHYLHGLYSHMMGVVPEYRHARVGMKLKLAQGEMARAKGYRLITWTYDPLEAPNARLNIGLLGAICNEYMPNYYGMLNDNRNQGIETDRFQVQWWVETPRVAMLLEQFSHGVEMRDMSLAGLHQAEVSREAAVINEVDTRADGLLVSDGPRLDLRGQELLLRVPKDFQLIKQQDQALAVQWRMQSRRVFANYFARGWTVTGYIPAEGFNSYVLQK